MDASAAIAPGAVGGRLVGEGYHRLAVGIRCDADGQAGREAEIDVFITAGILQPIYKGSGVVGAPVFGGEDQLALEEVSAADAIAT